MKKQVYLTVANLFFSIWAIWLKSKHTLMSRHALDAFSHSCTTWDINNGSNKYPIPHSSASGRYRDQGQVTGTPSFLDFDRTNLMESNNTTGMLAAPGRRNLWYNFCFPGMLVSFVDVWYLHRSVVDGIRPKLITGKCPPKLSMSTTCSYRYQRGTSNDDNFLTGLNK